MKIPKIIHYCWFGEAELPTSAKACMESWEKNCPDFEIKRWDESNFSSDDSQFVQQAIAKKKWAFVSDYFRLKALIEFGGIYLDTDVEMLKSPLEYMDHDVFLGFEDSQTVATSIIGSIPNHPFIKGLAEEYNTRHLILEDGTIDLTPNVVHVTKALTDKGLKKKNEFQLIDGIAIYPTEYFSPKDLKTGKITVTDKTCIIHHFDGSWLPLRNRVNRRVAQFLGPELTDKIKKKIRKKSHG